MESKAKRNKATLKRLRFPPKRKKTNIANLRGNLQIEKNPLKKSGYAIVEYFHSSRKALLSLLVQVILHNLVVEMYEKQPEHFSKIFQKFVKKTDGGYDKVDDENRVQVPLSALKEFWESLSPKQKKKLGGTYIKEGKDLFEAVDKFIAQALGRAKTMHSDYVVAEGSVQFLLSLPRGKHQELHTEYDIDNAMDFEKAAPGVLPLLMLSPLGKAVKVRIAEGKPGGVLHENVGKQKKETVKENQSCLYFNDGEIHELDEYTCDWSSLLVIHGYCPYAGCICDEGNVCLLFNVIPKGAPKDMKKQIGPLLFTKFSKQKQLFPENCTCH
jgi:hypothetical protein